MPRTIKKVSNQLPPEITSLQFMFIFCETFNQDISSWDTSHVKNMNWMFHGAISFNQDLSSWNTSNVKSMNEWYVW
ncbi:BspA family leucine-rich repeat surface protein [Spiroplasma endosymbiont of Notiophilus biguttatus]|uniref:BspA family leucine-rich repeat surface protein n=1 Tax=Spiroplasma endosymbiont of Notiophilus biguttatus TaxID=3066285 RepID=UPI00313CD807